MAIDYQLKGDFELSNDLKVLLKELLPPDTHEEPLSDSVVQFVLSCSLLNVTGFYSEIDRPEMRRSEGATLFFRLNKFELERARPLMLACVNAVLESTKGDLLFAFDETVFFRRRRGRLTLYDYSKDRPFWRREYLSIIEQPYLLEYKKEKRPPL